MGKTKKVTKEQVLHAINQWFVKHSVAPTIEELRRALKVGSTRTVLRYLRSLEEERLIERWQGARGIRMLKAPIESIETQSIPIVGQAPAGPLMLAEENIEGWVRVPKDFLRPPTSQFFLLRVRGDSMNQAAVHDEQIEDKDLVLVRQQPTADSGAIVVALVDGEATIKCLTHGQGYYLLKPISSNPENTPIIVDKDFAVQGIVCRVLKQGSELLNFMECYDG
jgi:repressor LexA